jgi:hypothetical protein
VVQTLPTKVTTPGVATPGEDPAQKEDFVDQTVAQIDTLSRSVAEQYATMQTAIEEERAAEADLLAQIVEAVRPALRALSSRLKASERTWWPDRVCTATERTDHPERGVVVAGDGPERDHPRANDGSVTGQDLVLLDDGTFALRDWSGSWSNWQGATSSQESTLTRISLRDVVESYDAENIAADLAYRLQAQLGGKATKTTAAARVRAEKLRSVSTLLAGGRK